jgi:hypothetical protein
LSLNFLFVDAVFSRHSGSSGTTSKKPIHTLNFLDKLRPGDADRPCSYIAGCVVFAPINPPLTATDTEAYAFSSLSCFGSFITAFKGLRNFSLVLLQSVF